MNYGFKEPIIDDTQYVEGDLRLGAVATNPSGDWTAWLPTYEAQADLYETYGCTCWGAHNQLEILHKYLYGTEPNYAERYNYNLANINPPGADPQVVYETIRKNGVVPTASLPLPPTLEEFKTPRPVPQGFKDIGAQFTAKYAYGHDWVITGNESQDARVAKLRAALQFSPIGVSVTSWYPEGDVYVDLGMPNNHWCVLFRMDDKFYYIFDSYDHSIKKLPFNHRIRYAKRISLMERTPEAKISLLERIVQALRELLGLQKELIEVTKPKVIDPPVKLVTKLIDAAVNAIGTDASPLDLAPDELSCAEGLSNIINSVIPQFPRSVLSTIQLKECLDDCIFFERITEPEPGCIIVSPRQLSTAGHAGIFLDRSIIISNSSATGTMQKNYTWTSWTTAMRDKRKLKIFLWRLKVDTL
jgi:hypothetical protein